MFNTRDENIVLTMEGSENKGNSVNVAKEMRRRTSIQVCLIEEALITLIHIPSNVIDFFECIFFYSLLLTGEGIVVVCYCCSCLLVLTLCSVVLLCFVLNIRNLITTFNLL